MTAAELLDQMNRHGAALEIVDGKPRVRGAKLPGELMAQLKANREAVLEEFEKRRAQDRDRYCRAPQEEILMEGREARLDEAMQREVLAYVARQGRVAQAWVLRRALEYGELGAPVNEHDWRACVDLIAWQRQTTAKGVVDFVSALCECAATCPPQPLAKEERKNEINDARK